MKITSINAKEYYYLMDATWYDVTTEDARRFHILVSGHFPNIQEALEETKVTPLNRILEIRELVEKPNV